MKAHIKDLKRNFWMVGNLEFLTIEDNQSGVILLVDEIHLCSESTNTPEMKKDVGT